MSHNVDLSDLPYFLLRDMFNSDGTHFFLHAAELLADFVKV
jgi:hypothetical protein